MFHQRPRQVKGVVSHQSGAFPMTGSIRRGRLIVVAALVVLVLLSFAIYYLARLEVHDGQVRTKPFSSSENTVWLLLAPPLLAIGFWRGYPATGWCIVSFYGLLALLCAYFSVMLLVIPLLFAGDNPALFADASALGVGFVLMGSVFGFSAAMFAAVCYVLAFFPSVRDFGKYCRELQQEALPNRQQGDG
jgi:hypothetical protein